MGVNFKGRPRALKRLVILVSQFLFLLTRRTSLLSEELGTVGGRLKAPAGRVGWAQCSQGWM